MLGDKKSVVKQHVLDLYSEPALHGVKRPELSFWKAHISGGNVSTAALVAPLQQALSQPELRSNARLARKVEARIHDLELFAQRSSYAPSCYLSLGGAKPGVSGGCQASATASFSGHVVAAGGEARVGATLQGPSIETSLKTTRYRLQLALRAVDQTGDRHRRVVTTQDTRILYGQCKLTAFDVQLEASAKIEQTAVDGERAGEWLSSKVRNRGKGSPAGADPEDHEVDAEATGTWRGFDGSAKAGASASARSLAAKADASAGFGRGVLGGRLEGSASAGAEISLGAIGAEAKAGASQSWTPNALNYMQYEAGFAVWSPPPHGSHVTDATVSLGPGSGYAFGQSVDVARFLAAVRRTADAGALGAYLQGLAGALGVTRKQIATFVANPEIATFAEFWSDPEAMDPALQPSAFLLEASFAVAGRTVPARLHDHRWTIGPFGPHTLIGHMTAGGHSAERLQAIRLRYRAADTKHRTSTFSLGVQYIAAFGISLKRIERAGSEAIINLGTVWFGKELQRYNDPGANQVDAYERAVPPVQLLHQ